MMLRWDRDGLRCRKRGFAGSFCAFRTKYLPQNAEQNVAGRMLAEVVIRVWDEIERDIGGLFDLAVFDASMEIKFVEPAIADRENIALLHFTRVERLHPFLDQRDVIVRLTPQPVEE